MDWRALLPCLLLLWATLSHAAEIRLAGQDVRVPLAGLVEVYEDKSANLDIDAVAETAVFARAPGLQHPGFTASAIWLKAEFESASPELLTRWLAVQPIEADEVTFFFRQGGQWQRLEAGTGLPAARRAVPAASAVFPFQLTPLARQTVYVRIASRMPIAIEPVVWEPGAFRAAESQVRLVDGMLLGGFVVMVLGAVLFAVMFRDRAFVFNALATATFFLGEFTAKGYSALHLWPEAMQWGSRCLPLFALLGVGLNILLVRDLLVTARRFPRIDKALLVLLTLQWLPAVGVLFGDLRRWAELAFAPNFPATLALLFLGAYAVRQGIHAARYYTAAYAVLALGSLLHALALSGVFPPGMGGAYALPVAMFLANALLMASVVDRVMQVRREKVAAQEALLAAHASHEAQLQQEVLARTAELEAANREILHLAFYDPLTNLANRRLLQDRLRLAIAASRRSGRFGALLLMDLDNFKALNDTYGHAVGDRLLVEVAHRLRDCVRVTDTIARLGGDEFVVVIGELASEEGDSSRQAEAVAGKILARLSEPYVLATGEAGDVVRHACSASIGGTLFDGHAVDTAVLDAADGAMYRAKAAGRNTLNFSHAKVIA